jgi:hypothetical protein
MFAVAASVVVMLNEPSRTDAATGILDAPTLAEIYEPDRSVSVAAVQQGSIQAAVTVRGAQLTLEAYGPGVVPAGELAAWRARGTRTTVNGRPGFSVIGEYPSLMFGPSRAPDPPTPTPALAWEYATGAWAFLGCVGCNATTAPLREAAAMVRLGPAAPITVPARLGYLPDGYQLWRVERQGLDGNGPSFTRADRPYRLSLWFKEATDTQRSVIVEATPNNGTDWHDDWPAQRPPEQTINGHAVWWIGDDMLPTPKTMAYADFGSCHLFVQTPQHEETIRVIANLEVATCTDTSTWWDARSIGLPPGIAEGRPMPIWLPSRD